jgi:hypothetical protein
LTIAELFENGEKQMGANFIKYDAFKNSCQDFVLGLLRGSGLSSSGSDAFIKQDIKKLIEKTPSYSTAIAKSIIDFAGDATNAVSALRDKRGGIIFGRKSKSIR